MMHKLAKEKLAEWLHTEEDNCVVEEYPIVPYHCGTWDGGYVNVVGVGEKVKGGWHTGKTYDELLKNPTEPLYPVAICDVFTYSKKKFPEAREIWEVRYTNSVTPVKRKAILDCYHERGWTPTPPHFFEVDASAILNFDYKVKPKDALRKLRLTLKDLNPMAQLSEKEWKERFATQDSIEYERELEKRFRESDEYKEHQHDVETRRQAKKEEVDQAMKTLQLENFFNTDSKTQLKLSGYPLKSSEALLALKTTSHLFKIHVERIPSRSIPYNIEGIRGAWMAQNDKRLSAPTKKRLSAPINAAGDTLFMQWASLNEAFSNRQLAP